MRKATAENRADIISKIAKEIAIGKLTSIRILMKKVDVKSSDFLETSLSGVLAYHMGRAEKILETEGRQKALEYAEREIVPQVEYCEGHGAMVKAVPLINILRENALKRSSEVRDYLTSKGFMEGPEEVETAAQDA